MSTQGAYVTYTWRVIRVWRGAWALTAALVLMLAAPHIALADGVPVETRVVTVSGVALVSQLARDLARVDVGSQGATFTVDVEGSPAQIPVSYATAFQGNAGGDIASFVLVGLALGAALKFLGLLLRLGT